MQNANLFWQGNIALKCAFEAPLVLVRGPNLPYICLNGSPMNAPKQGCVPFHRRSHKLPSGETAPARLAPRCLHVIFGVQNSLAYLYWRLLLRFITFHPLTSPSLDAKQGGCVVVCYALILLVLPRRTFTDALRRESVCLIGYANTHTNPRLQYVLGDSPNRIALSSFDRQVFQAPTVP